MKKIALVLLFAAACSKTQETSQTTVEDSAAVDLSTDSTSVATPVQSATETTATK